MRISERWLREWVSVRFTTAELVDRLALAGIETGRAGRLAALPKVVVGRVLSCEPHPQADRLQVCRVAVGAKTPLTIVCGAPNARSGVTVPVALPDARLPDGRTLSEAPVRGVTSQGMLCSAAELGLEETAEGLWLLPSILRPGASIDRVLALPDELLEVELTPNRGDCLSIAGLARELSALTGTRMTPPKQRRMPIKSKRRLTVSVRNKAECPRYIGRVVTGIDPTATTPLWMIERLRRSGIRSIHPVVDVTNYVMLELGQPMHAFDLDRLDGGITVRKAAGGERLRLLDERELELRGDELVIADRTGPLALAGVMGGLGSAVNAGTQHLFLESAYFQPEVIASGARRNGLHTDSSHRFERGVDFDLQRASMERASGLLQEIVGGEFGPLTEVLSKSHLPKRPTITLRAQRITRVLGTTPSPSDVQTALRRLGMKITRAREGWRVTPPSYRFDIKEEIDLIEEVARVHGYAQIPTALPLVPATGSAVPERQIPRRRTRALLVDRGYQEIISYSFVDPSLLAQLDPGGTPAMLSNPIASNMAVMRTTLWAGLVEAVRHNLHRQQERIRVFEIGARFHRKRRRLTEETTVAGAITGAVTPLQWSAAARPVDFFDLKGDVEALLALGGRQDLEFVAAAHPALHPGRSACIRLGGEDIGWLGEIHPNIAANVDLRQPVYVFEVLFSAIETATPVNYREISRFPSIRRDLAVVVDERIPSAQVLSAVRLATGELLTELHLFDEYRGEGIDSGRKSLALALTLQDSSRTLNDEAVQTVIGEVVAALQAAFGAQLRQ